MDFSFFLFFVTFFSFFLFQGFLLTLLHRCICVLLYYSICVFLYACIVVWMYTMGESNSIVLTLLSKQLDNLINCAQLNSAVWNRLWSVFYTLIMYISCISDAY